MVTQRPQRSADCRRVKKMTMENPVELSDSGKWRRKANKEAVWVLNEKYFQFKSLVTF